MVIGTIDPEYQILSDNEIDRNIFEEEVTKGVENETDDDLTEGEYGSSHSEVFNALDLAF